MQVKPKHETRVRAMSPQSAVEMIIDSAPDFNDGQLEGLNRKVEKLTRLVGALVEKLPTEQAVLDFLNEHDYHSWEAV